MKSERSEWHDALSAALEELGLDLQGGLDALDSGNTGRARAVLENAQRWVGLISGGWVRDQDPDGEPDYVLAAVILNAAKHRAKHGTPFEPWDDHVNLRYLRRLIEEVGELASALHGNHEHPMELEIIQIAGIAINWLRAGSTPERIATALRIDEQKHPSDLVAERLPS